MNEEIIGIEVSGEIYPIKDEETSGKAQTLGTKVQKLETIVDTHSEELRELTMLINDTTTSTTKTWSSKKIKDSLDSIEEEVGNVYSTEETVCGKWIDNKSIYRKVIDRGAWKSAGAESVGNLNISRIIKLDVLCADNSDGSGNQTTYNAIGGLNSRYVYYKASDKLMIINGEYYSRYIIIEYTKTTD